MDSRELAWAAGFFDGEGWAAASRMGRGEKTRPAARVNQADPRNSPAVLVRFRDALGGLGRIGGPYVEDGRVDLYRWIVSSRRDVEMLHRFLAPWLAQVKLDQLAAAIGCTAQPSATPTGSEEWTAWAAGLYDGEGSTYLSRHRTHVGYQNAEARITQGSPLNVPEVLSRFLQIVGHGHINGPYLQEDANLLVYRWNSSRYADIDHVLTTMWPWLGPVKREQASAVRAVMLAQPPLPRGRPDWGNRKTHCINGHEYAKTRLRPYVSRGMDREPRDSEQCLQCAREQARARRAQKKSSAEDGGRSISEHAASYLLK